MIDPIDGMEIKRLPNGKGIKVTLDTPDVTVEDCGTLLKVSAVCNVCHERTSFVVTHEQWYNYTHGMIIQRALPDVSADDAELILNGVCGKCFDKLFAEDER